MATSKFFTLKEARLSNNCPECYSNDGLEIKFKQRFTENAFYKAITSDLSHSIHCHICDTTIFPARWTNDLERVIDYQQRAVNPKSKSIKLKPLAWVVILLDILVVLLIVLIMTDVITL